MRRIEQSNPSPTQVGKEILSDIAGRELDHRRIVKCAADNGAPDSAMRVLKQWISKVGVRGRTRTFTNAPAIISILAWRNLVRHCRRRILQSAGGPIPGQLCRKVFLCRPVWGMDSTVRSCA